MARNNPLSLGRDLAIDLGTANTLIYVRGQGVVLDLDQKAVEPELAGQLQQGLLV